MQQAEDLAREAREEKAAAEAKRLESQRKRLQAERAAAQAGAEKRKKPEDKAEAAAAEEVPQREMDDTAVAKRALKNAESMLEDARELQAESEEQQLKAERLQAMCEKRRDKYAERVKKLRDDPHAFNSLVDIDSSDDEAVDQMLDCSLKVQLLEATRCRFLLLP